MRIDRREFCIGLAASLAAGAACSRPPDEPARTTLVRVLGLTASQARWVDSLKPAQQEELRQRLLARSSAPDRHTIELLMRIFGRRDRLFAYVGYPPLPQLGACDGLIRE